MAINEEQLQLLVGELLKLRTNISGMVDNSTKSRITLERIDKTLSTQSKSTNKNDAISYDVGDSTTDDMNKTIHAHQQVVDKIKEENSKTSEDKEKDDNQKKSKEKKIYDDKLLHHQMRTNDYLNVLAKLSEKNDRRVTEKSESNKRGILSSTYGITQSALNRTGQGGSKIGGGLGDLMKGFREMGLSIQSTKEYLTGGFSSNRRKKKIDTITKKINKDKALLSAEQDKVDRLRKSGASDADMDTYLKNMSKRKSQVRLNSREFGDLISKENLYQLGRSDKNYRAMDKRDKGLLYDHTRRNISASVMRDVKGIESNRNTSTVMHGGIGSSSLQKNITTRKRGSSTIFTTPISTSSKPSTYGEYIAGIYHEVNSLNNLVDRIKPRDRESSKSSSSGGGFLSGLFSGLLPMLTRIVMRPLSRLFKPLTRSFSKIGKRVTRPLRNIRAANYRKMRQSAKGRDALKSSRVAKVTKSSKGLFGMGTKTALTTATKSASKTGAKSAMKKIPVLGALAGLGFAGYEAMQGNYGRSALELASGVAGAFPGVGTGISLGLDGILATDSLRTSHKHSNQKTPISPQSKLMNTNNMRYDMLTRSDTINVPELNNIKRQTMVPKTTLTDVRSMKSRENKANMEMQAKLIGMEVAKIYTTSSYLDIHSKIAKIQGHSVGNSIFG